MIRFLTKKLSCLIPQILKMTYLYSESSIFFKKCLHPRLQLVIFLLKISVFKENTSYLLFRFIVAHT